MQRERLSQEEQNRLREEVKDEAAWADFGIWPMLSSSILVKIYWHRQTGKILFEQVDDGPCHGSISDPTDSYTISDTPERAMQFCSTVLVRTPLALKTHGKQ
jgi:hypothetical protein